MSSPRVHGRCKSCGSEVREFQYQMRSADEAHTSVWSCSTCPLDASRISTSDPKSVPGLLPLRSSHHRSLSVPIKLNPRQYTEHCYVEAMVIEHPPRSKVLYRSRNTRRLCSVLHPSTEQEVPSQLQVQGPYAGSVVRLRRTQAITPTCRVVTVEVYKEASCTRFGDLEDDGEVSCIETELGHRVYVYERAVAGKGSISVVVKLNSASEKYLKDALTTLYSTQGQFQGMRSFVSRDHLAALNNASPRAWDSKITEKRGALYSPKVDGERAYVAVYGMVCHVFRRGKGYDHIGWRVLDSDRLLDRPVFIDVENTLSHGCFFIDMLTDEKGSPSPKQRDYAWSLKEFMKVRASLGIGFISPKKHYESFRGAEESLSSCPYYTDGVIALWPGTTTARKMKRERSIELTYVGDGNLVTSDGDTVIQNARGSPGLEAGCIVEVRFKLSQDGKGLVSKPLFKRVDKMNANSTSAVRSILSSFGSVKRDDETRRRSILVWCESLKQHLVKLAVSLCGPRRIILDVGSGGGQSLDVMTQDAGVSYIMIEPNADRCEALRKRAGVKVVHTDPRTLLSSVKHLKSGSQTYTILCCTLEKVLSDQEVMSLISSEVASATALFSAQYVISGLYDLSQYWSIPVIGCFYPYDGVGVGKRLVDSLGIKMLRSSPSECLVKWGGDKAYTEPYTVVSEYESFSPVHRAVDIVQPPDPKFDREVSEVCRKVYVASPH